MDRSKIEELMRETDYVYGSVQELQGMPLSDNNVSIIHNVQQLMKKVYMTLKEDLDKMEKPAIENEEDAEDTEEMKSNA